MPSKKVSPKAATTNRNLPVLTPSERSVLAHVVNGLALGTLQKDCSAETIAAQLGKTPGRLKPTLRKLVAKGYITVDGEWLECVAPTTAALMVHDNRLTEKQAAAALAKLGLSKRGSGRTA